MRKLLIAATLASVFVDEVLVAATLFAGDDAGGAFVAGLADVCEWRHGTPIESVPSASARSAGKTGKKCLAARPSVPRLGANRCRAAESGRKFFTEALEYFFNDTTRASVERARRELTLSEKFVLINHGPYRHFTDRGAAFDAHHAALAAYPDAFRQRNLRG